MRATRTDTGELGESLKLLETLPGNLARDRGSVSFFVHKQIVILGEWIPVEQAVSSSPIHETHKYCREETMHGKPFVYVTLFDGTKR